MLMLRFSKNHKSQEMQGNQIFKQLFISLSFFLI